MYYNKIFNTLNVFFLSSFPKTVALNSDWDYRQSFIKITHDSKKKKLKVLDFEISPEDAIFFLVTAVIVCHSRSWHTWFFCESHRETFPDLFLFFLTSFMCGVWAVTHALFYESDILRPSPSTNISPLFVVVEKHDVF